MMFHGTKTEKSDADPQAPYCNAFHDEVDYLRTGVIPGVTLPWPTVYCIFKDKLNDRSLKYIVGIRVFAERSHGRETRFCQRWPHHLKKATF
jgi:hypothetical protein